MVTLGCVNASRNPLPGYNVLSAHYSEALEDTAYCWAATTNAEVGWDHLFHNVRSMREFNFHFLDGKL